MTEKGRSLDNSLITLALIRSLIEQYARMSRDREGAFSTQAYITMVKRLMLCLLGGLVDYFEQLVGTLEENGKTDESLHELHHEFRARSRRILGETTSSKISITLADVMAWDQELDDVSPALLDEAFSTASILEARIRSVLES